MTMFPMAPMPRPASMAGGPAPAPTGILDMMSGSQGSLTDIAGALSGMQGGAGGGGARPPQAMPPDYPRPMNPAISQMIMEMMMNTSRGGGAPSTPGIGQLLGKL